MERSSCGHFRPLLTQQHKMMSESCLLLEHVTTKRPAELKSHDEIYDVSRKNW